MAMHASCGTAQYQQAHREHSPPDASSAQPVSVYLLWRRPATVHMCCCSCRS